MNGFLSVARALWRLLPTRVRGFAPLAGFRSLLLSGKLQVISTLDELDRKLGELDVAAAVSDDELRRCFATFSMDYPIGLPKEPSSAEYRDWQFELYRWIHGGPYSSTNEASSFDVANAAAQPFPYLTRSPSTVGNHLIAIGHVIRTLDLPAGSRVLEFGPGWGNTTIALARMGYKVTAIDIEQNFVDLIKERARRKNLAVDVRQGDFACARQLDSQYDAVLFFECFHHCADHRGMIAGLDRIVAPGGRVIFAAEPIYEEFPIPWGLRLDGESLWAIRKHGWLELGFKESYFTAAMKGHGWRLAKSVCTETPWGTVFTARRIVEP